ncbi:hypothetical protein GALMADRAFT_241731 [Galerina marginata CBS 339.88]|uniref:Rhodopsin domain-containing protein n=1 Tax=Galerina marginata (strain CBS 339.88) TaxID=685588 RepID=A0A067TDD2_GALM3|nr:hypothetical protein GALMADRAFT_241731 [Galerina marginata CBS 339.88]
MTLSPQAAIAWEVGVTLLQAIAIASTVVRLAHRWRTDRMWWDDWTAFPPLFFDIMYVIILWLRVATIHSSRTKGEVFLFSTIFNVFLFRSVVWLSRISLALGISRIFPPKHRCRYFAFGLAALFLCAYIVNITTTALFHAGPPASACSTEDKECTRAAVRVWIMNLITLTFDAFADVILVVTPPIMLWKVRLPRNQRRLVLALFSSSILSFLASLAFVLVWMLNSHLGPNGYFIMMLCAHLQAFVCLLVCNLLVVTMLFYRVFRRVTLPDPSPTSESSFDPGLPEHPSKTHTTISNPSAPTPQHLNLSRLSDSPPETQSSNSTMTFTTIYEGSSLPSTQLSALPTSRSDSNGPTWTTTPSFDDTSSSSKTPPWSFPE